MKSKMEGERDRKERK